MVDIPINYGQAGASGHESHGDNSIGAALRDLATDLQAAGVGTIAWQTALDLTDLAAATASITFPAAANIVDGETFTLIDADGTTVVFEFDRSNTNTPGAGNVEVNVSADTTAATVADRARTAINAATIDMTAGAPTGGVLPLAQDAAGASGNTTIADTVADAGFTHTDFTGGTDAVLTLDQPGYVLHVDATAGSGTGPKDLISSGTPSAGQALLQYDADGIPTLTFALADAVTAASVLQIRRPADYTGQLTNVV